MSINFVSFAKIFIVFDLILQNILLLNRDRPGFSVDVVCLTHSGKVQLE